MMKSECNYIEDRYTIVNTNKVKYQKQKNTNKVYKLTCITD